MKIPLSKKEITKLKIRGTRRLGRILVKDIKIKLNFYDIWML